MADKRVATRGQDSSTQAVVELLTSILGEVQKQVQSKTPSPLSDKAPEAVDLFAEIGAALALQPLPTITLTAQPNQFGVNGGTTKLTWAATDARRVSIDPGVGDVTQVEAKFIDVPVVATTTFTATATGPCGNATASATVTVQVLG
jgi:hypothetical protein